jgi:hypothetical protein
LANIASSPIHDASSDFADMTFSSSSCGKRMALKPNIMPTLRDTVSRMIVPATYFWEKDKNNQGSIL